MTPDTGLDPLSVQAMWRVYATYDGDLVKISKALCSVKFKRGATWVDGYDFAVKMLKGELTDC